MQRHVALRVTVIIGDVRNPVPHCADDAGCGTGPPLPKVPRAPPPLPLLLLLLVVAAALLLLGPLQPLAICHGCFAFGRGRWFGIPTLPGFRQSEHSRRLLGSSKLVPLNMSTNFGFAGVLPGNSSTRTSCPFRRKMPRSSSVISLASSLSAAVTALQHVMHECNPVRLT